jgi:hypothetical protein
MTRRIPCRKCGTLKFFHTFDFEDQAVFDNEVDSISDGQLYLFVNQWQTNLVFNVQSGIAELVEHASVVRAFQGAGSDCAVHFHRSTNNGVTRFIWKHLCGPL